jgi:hypothetical protein
MGMTWAKVRGHIAHMGKHDIHVEVLKESIEDATYVPGLYVVFSGPPGEYWNSNLRQAMATAF